MLDQPQVRADLRYANGIVHIPQQLDATSVGERIEGVGRRSLVHTHRHLASLLHGRE